MVVEHDTETMMAADWLVDVGPGAGEEGGEICLSGPLDVLLSHSRSGKDSDDSRIILG